MDNYSNLSKALTTSLQAGLETINQALPSNFCDWINQYQQSLEKLADPKILLLEPNSLKFCAAIIAFWQVGRGSLFLGNPAWQVAELSQVAQQLHPDRLWASSTIETRWLSTLKPLQDHSTRKHPHPINEPLMYFPTGGSSGKIRFAAHSLSTLTAAVTGVQHFIEPFLPPSGNINSFCVLPLFHVGGLLQWWRSALTKGQFCVMDYATVKQTPPGIPATFITSLVPTQLQYFLDHQPQFLQQFSVIFLGGAPAWTELLNQDRVLHINLAPTYGMTESAGQIATLTPTEFLQGKTGVGRILPHANVTLNPVNVASVKLSSNDGRSGLISIQSDSLCLGYYPQLETPDWWQTGDLGYLDNNYLTIIGRHQRQIISGGENIDPLEIENCLLNYNLVKDIVIVGVGDRHWGEMVTAIFVPRADVSQDRLIETVKNHLAPHKCPKQWLPVSEIRRSPLGKINYAALQTWAEEQLSP
ncbi:MAG: AMP-binding protein [Synechocystis sp.]